MNVSTPIAEESKSQVATEWALYGPVPLTRAEAAAALLEAKKKKYFHQNRKAYWALTEQDYYTSNDQPTNQ